MSNGNREEILEKLKDFIEIFRKFKTTLCTYKNILNTFQQNLKEL